MSSDPVGAFGAVLKRYRRAAGLTQEELAERASISRRSLGDMERGAVWRAPRKDTVALLIAVGARPGPAGARRPGREAAPLVGAARHRCWSHQCHRPIRPRWWDGHGSLGCWSATWRVPAARPCCCWRASRASARRACCTRRPAARRARGWCVLEGGCQRRGGQEPYAPLLDALQRLPAPPVAGPAAPDLAGCAWLVRLLPELAAGPIEPLPAWTLPPEQERRLMFEAVARFLTNVAGPAGTLLLLDDLQWAGPDALDLLRHPGPSPRGARAGDGRLPRHGGAAGGPRSRSVADLAHARLAAPDPRAPHHSGGTAARMSSGGAESRYGRCRRRGRGRERVVQRTGGVPFFVVSCAQALRLGRRGEAAGRGALGRGAERPATRRGLPRTVQEVLGVAAVVGACVPARPADGGGRNARA